MCVSQKNRNKSNGGNEMKNYINFAGGDVAW